MRRVKMRKQWCNTENDLGGEAHYAHESSFDWIMFRGDAKFWCEDCRHEAEELMEEEEDE
tara:strand:+ start:311 stop:490 length:180 start_codon:yes stop_codon:yes gene_type:complete